MVFILKSNIRNGDTVVRFGGEEFLVVLPYADHKKACKIAERLRKSVENHVFQYGQHNINITISLGVSVYDPSDCAEKELQEILKEADEKLYCAKRSGRNKVVC